MWSVIIFTHVYYMFITCLLFSEDIGGAEDGDRMSLVL